MEKVIRELETLGAWHTHHYAPFHYEAAETIHDALALLKEQEAVKPDGYKCGKCGYTVHRINYDGPYNGIRHELFKFCPSCGRKVKWDD